MSRKKSQTDDQDTPTDTLQTDLDSGYTDPKDNDQAAPDRSRRRVKIARASSWAWYVGVVNDADQVTELLLPCKSRRRALAYVEMAQTIPAYRGKRMRPVRVSVY